MTRVKRPFASTEATVLVPAFKPSVANPGNYEMTWWRTCGPNYTTMKTSYTMEELEEKPELMQTILDKAKAIDGCTSMLTSIE
ncbi:hypothetical protein [Microbulbifer magnicolonia]|uniref:hypothetical protein n=1 Tax=Microbulbifer magnicolonia TaxID=3109744 RepID=UPI002B40A647|nr:hypothetical protein [Microbulbifer sp. GG15]